MVQLSLQSAIFSCFQGDVQHDIDNCINPHFTQSVEAAASLQCLLLNRSPSCDRSAKKMKCLPENNGHRNMLWSPSASSTLGASYKDSVSFSWAGCSGWPLISNSFWACLAHWGLNVLNLLKND